MKTKKTMLAVALALAAGGSALAAVSPEEAKQLGNALTPWGAIKSGNKEGTIPPYEGGLPVTTAPPGFVKNSGFYPDPFADEKPLYSITAKNMDQYTDKLSETTREMLKRFPATYRVNVYPTHRVVNYPKYFLDSTIANATRCKTIEDGLALANCIGGLAFPIPKTGNEVIFNVQTSYKAPTAFDQTAIYVDSTGSPVVSAVQDAIDDSPYSNPKETMEHFYKNGALYFRGVATNKYPPNTVGNGTLVHWSVDPVDNPNKGWTYQPGNRRVRAIPDAQYDYPLIPSGGAEFFDEVYIFTGKMDRFDFKLLGTKEMIIPYGEYRACQAGPSEMTAVGGGRHPNPDMLRWELHRVYVVEATLKPGARHAFSKRRFYIDEDNPQAGMADAWDHAGKIWRGNFSLSFWAYDAQSAFGANSIEFDLSSGIWYLPSSIGKMSIKFLNNDTPDSIFTPEGLARRTAR